MTDEEQFDPTLAVDSRSGPELNNPAAVLRSLIPKGIDLVTTAYRMTAPRWATRENFLTGEGARKAGGRWNPVESFRTVYLSMSTECSLQEYLQQNRRNGLPDEEALPGTMTAVRVRISRILDLTDPNVLAILGVTLEGLVMEVRGPEMVSPTQEMGKNAKEVGFKGLLVPSAAKQDDANLVVSPDNLDRIELIHPLDLPG